MHSVKVNKTEALQILRKNLKSHQAIFEEAVAGYRAQVIALLESHITDIKAGKVKTVAIQLPGPENQTKDYERAIKMLEMSVDDVIELDEHRFQSYIMDDWSWKRQFLVSNSSYSKTASDLMAT